MKTRFNQFFHDQSGVTALETAIILIAFVVVAAVFAFTMLTTGTFMTERSKEAAYSGLAQVRGSVEIKGSVIAKGATAVGGVITSTDHLVFTVANVAGGQPVDFTPPDGSTIAACTNTDPVATTPSSPAGNVVNISYRDAGQSVLVSNWNVCSIGYSDGTNMLQDRELFEVMVPLSGLSTPLASNTSFDIEIKPQSGAVVDLQRGTPPTLQTVMDLR
jgi:archaeal flagellin FlaB